MNTYWLSFATDGGNLGVCLVDAETLQEAIQRTHFLGINPGGEVMSFVMPTGEPEIARWGKDHLIKPEEFKAAGYKKLSEVDEATANAIESHPDVAWACRKHNT
jgi:hypothetical protein